MKIAVTSSFVLAAIATSSLALPLITNINGAASGAASGMLGCEYRRQFLTTAPLQLSTHSLLPSLLFPSLFLQWQPLVLMEP